MRITTTTCPAASRRADYARDAVFAAFRPQQARAIDQGAFVDRAPDQGPRQHSEVIARRQAVLERLAHALRLDGDDARPSAA